MPVLQIFAPSADDMEVRLTDACRVVCRALDLPADAVIATHVPVGATVRHGHDSPCWPVVVVHGAAREQALMDRAIDALAELARTWTDGAEAWVTWQAPR